MSSNTAGYSLWKVCYLQSQTCLWKKNFTLNRWPYSFVTYALLGSYTAQAELGDFNEHDHGTTVDYLRDLEFAPVPDEELLRRIHDQHKRHTYVEFCWQSLNIGLNFCLFIVDNHQMQLIYIFLKMLRNWQCMVLIFIQHK